MSFQRIFNRLNNQANRLLKPVRRQDGKDDAAILSPEIFLQLNRLQLNASKFLPGYSTGARSSFRRNPALEFREHRMYVPGDDVRFVDWKASGRQEHIFIKQGEYPKEATVYVLVDCSLSMNWGKPPKIKTAVQLAAILSYLTLNQSDKLFLIPFSDHLFQPLGPINGKGQFLGTLNYLHALQVRGTVNYPVVMKELRQRLGKSGGLVLIISDFFELDRPKDLLNFFPVPRWDTVFLHILHPDEISPQVMGDLEFLDIETGLTTNYDINKQVLADYNQRIQIWQEGLALACIEKSAFYALIPAGGDDKELVAQLRNLHLVNSL